MRFKSFIAGVVLAGIAITAGSVMLSSRQERRVQLERENERLVQQQQALVRKAEQLDRERKELTKVVQRLSVEKRVAEIDVLQQHVDELGRVRQTILRLTEYGRDGKPLPSQVFGVPSAVPHFDALVIKFQNDYVAKGDQLRGRSIALFRRVYGETQAPQDGYWLGTPGSVPDVYRVNPEPTDFELGLWREFWSYVIDPKKAEEAGVRVAQGEAVYAPMRPGEHWILTLEADGGLNLIKQSGPVATPGPMAPPVAANTAPSKDARLHAPSPLDEK